MLEFEPVIGKFVALVAAPDMMIKFRLLLAPYPPEDWAKKFDMYYPVLPKGVDTWFRSPAIIEIDCPFNILRNVKHRMQTYINEVNLWYEKEVAPLLSLQEASMLDSIEGHESGPMKLQQMVDQANTILEERFSLDGLSMRGKEYDVI